MFLQESISVGPELLHHIAKSCVEIIAFLHRNNVVHRDLKHSSVYLLQTGKIHIITFALKKIGFDRPLVALDRGKLELFCAVLIFQVALQLLTTALMAKLEKSFRVLNEPNAVFLQPWAEVPKKETCFAWDVSYCHFLRDLQSQLFSLFHPLLLPKSFKTFSTGLIRLLAKHNS